MKKDFISIIAPVKNEKENIKKSINDINKHVKFPHEIIIVYDLENDNTLPILKILSKKQKNLIIQKNKMGTSVASAIKTGFKIAKGNLLVIMAVDGTDDPKTINRMVDLIHQGYDLICPSRYSKGAKVISKTNLKLILSKIAGISTPILLGIPTKDLTYSFKLFKKEILNEIKIESAEGFEFAEELLIKAYNKGFKISEVPTIWKDRTLGKSKFKLYKWLPGYIRWYLMGLKYRIKNI